MSHDVAVPLWLLVLLIVGAVVAALQWLLLPGVRWYFRRKVRRVLDEISIRLKIDLPQFKLTRRRALIDRLMIDPRVSAAAQQYAQEHGEPLAATMRRVATYAREIVPAFNAYVYFRVGYWLAKTFARLVYRVRLGSTDEQALAAVNPKSTVVFVMNHRSNMDYILVSFLAAERVALSYAVGEWARIWPLQGLIRAMGAYFVRRNSGDPLYRMVLQRYVQMATEGGVPQAMYPEGGLTRRRTAARAQAGPARLHAEGLQPGRRTRPRVHSGGHQLRPRDRGPHAAAQAGRGGATRAACGARCASPPPTSAARPSSRCSADATDTATPA